MRDAMTLQQIAEVCARAGGLLPLPPSQTERSVFAEPWQAHAFAMTLQLHAKGVFGWGEWATALAQEIAQASAAGQPDDGTTYYVHWLNTLEKMLLTRRITTPEQVHALEHAWEAAAQRTPHGEPIFLGAGDALYLD